MAKRRPLKPDGRLFLTPDDLKGLIQSLGALVRESVREEVGAQVRAALKLELIPLRQDMDRFESCIRDVIRLTTDALALERQRLAKERDLEHRSFLGKIDLARHPERPGATMEQLREAEQTAAAFRAGEQAQRESEARDDGIAKRDDRPVVVDGEVVSPGSGNAIALAVRP